MLPYAVIFDLNEAWSQGFPDLTPEELRRYGFFAENAYIWSIWCLTSVEGSGPPRHPQAGRRALVSAAVAPVVVVVVAAAAPGSHPLHDRTISNSPSTAARPHCRHLSNLDRRRSLSSFSCFDHHRPDKYRQSRGCRSAGHREFLHRRH